MTHVIEHYNLREKTDRRQHHIPINFADRRSGVDRRSKRKDPAEEMFAEFRARQFYSQ